MHEEKIETINGNVIYAFSQTVNIKHIVCLAMYLSVGSGSVDDFSFIPYTLLDFPNFLEYVMVFFNLKYLC